MSIPFQQIREVRRARADEAASLACLLAVEDAGGQEFAPPADAPRTVTALLDWIASDARELYVAAPVTEGAVGIAAVAPTDDAATARLALLVVGAANRRRGWGTRLARQALVWARRRGASALVAPRPPDGSADRFAASLGWRLTDDSFVAEVSP